MFNNRTFAVTICLTIFITVGTSFWYFGHHRPTQKILNAEPVKKYNTVTPLQPKTQPSNIPATTTSQEQSDLRENTEQSRDTSVSQGKEEAEHKHLQSKEEQEASKKLKAEAEAALEFAEQTQKESFELMHEAIPIIVNHLNTLSPDKQRKLLQKTKRAMVKRISPQIPPELQPLLIDDFNILEEGWKMYLDMLADYGYTLPKGIE